MKTGLVILVALLCLPFSTRAQEVAERSSEDSQDKIIECVRIDTKIIIDGILDEKEWSSAELISDFTT